MEDMHPRISLVVDFSSLTDHRLITAACHYVDAVYAGSSPHSGYIAHRWDDLVTAGILAAAIPNSPPLNRQVLQALALSDKVICCHDEMLIPLHQQPLRGYPHERYEVLKYPIRIEGSLISEYGEYAEFAFQAHHPRSTMPMEPSLPLCLMQAPLFQGQGTGRSGYELQASSQHQAHQPAIQAHSQLGLLGEGRLSQQHENPGGDRRTRDNLRTRRRPGRGLDWSRV